jgi:hypothetical protein
VKLVRLRRFLSVFSRVFFGTAQVLSISVENCGLSFCCCRQAAKMKKASSKVKGKRRASITKFRPDGQKVTIELKAKPKPPPE